MIPIMTSLSVVLRSKVSTQSAGDGDTHLIVSSPRTTFHRILSERFFDNISTNNWTYWSVTRSRDAFRYVGDRAVQYRVYRVCSEGGGRRGERRAGPAAPSLELSTWPEAEAVAGAWPVGREDDWAKG